MTEFWLVRHGPTHAKGMVGWRDIPADLSDTAALARLNAYLPNAPVVSSDLIRCIHTADTLENRTRLPHEIGLREINFGDWDGKTFDVIEAADPILSRAYWETPGDIKPPNGESWNEASARVSQAVDALNGPEHLIIVAHFGAILTQLQRAANMSARSAISFKIDNLSVTRLKLLDGFWSINGVNHTP